MYYVGIVLTDEYICRWDHEGLQSDPDHHTAIGFDTELAAWYFLLLVADQVNYDVDDLYVQFLDFEEEN